MVDTYAGTSVPRSCLEDQTLPSAEITLTEVLADGTSAVVGIEATSKVESWAAGSHFKILVQYQWHGYPRKDFTVSVYSKDTSNQIIDKCGSSHMLHTDGQEPSEWTSSTYAGMWDSCEDPLEINGSRTGSSYYCDPVTNEGGSDISVQDTDTTDDTIEEEE